MYCICNHPGGCALCTYCHNSVLHHLLFRLKWSEVAQSCPTVCDPMDCSPPGSSVHGIFQARILEWVAISQPTKCLWSSTPSRIHAPNTSWLHFYMYFDVHIWLANSLCISYIICKIKTHRDKINTSTLYNCKHSPHKQPRSLSARG